MLQPSNDPNAPAWARHLTAKPWLTGRPTEDFDLYDGDRIVGCTYVVRGERCYAEGRV